MNKDKNWQDNKENKENNYRDTINKNLKVQLKRKGDC